MTPRTRSNLVWVSIFGVACVLGLLFMAVNMGYHYPGQPGWHLKATFTSADGLVPEAEVRVAGVQVGNVVAIGPDGQGATTVDMLIYPSIKLRSDVHAYIRPKSLLGEKYIEITRDPASTASYEKDGATLPASATGQSVEIDSVLNNMDPQARAAFTQSLRQLGVAVDGQAADINTSIPNLASTAANLRPLAQTADARQKEIDRILTDLNVIMQALADEQDSLGRVVDSGNTVFSGIASRDQQLSGTLSGAATLLGSADQAFNGTTDANRSSIAKGPQTIQSGRTMLSILNPELDRILPETLLAQVNYPSNQLEVAHSQGVGLAFDWMSAFSEKSPITGLNSFRVTNYACQPSDPAKGCDTGTSSVITTPNPATTTSAPAGGLVTPSALLFILNVGSGN